MTLRNAGADQLRILCAPDSFQGAYSSLEVSSVFAAAAASLGFEPISIPLADGGVGTLDVLSTILGGDYVTVSVEDALSQEIQANYLMLDGGSAIVEMARASGISLIPEESRDPVRASTYGTGQLIVDAVRQGAEEIFVTVGGSATTDGGRGAIKAIEKSGVLVRGDARITVLTDVDICFEQAPAVFGPQKGADDAMIRRLAQRLDRFAQKLPKDPRGVPGTGAAGGLSGGLWAMYDAEIVDGAERIISLAGFNDRLHGADIVITGERAPRRRFGEGRVVRGLVDRALRQEVPIGVVFAGTPASEHPLSGEAVVQEVEVDADLNVLEAAARHLIYRMSEELVALRSRAAATG